MDYIGIDIGGTKTAVCLSDEKGNIVDKLKMQSNACEGPGSMIKRMFALIDEMMLKNKVKNNDILSFGISCGGPLDSKHGVILNPPNLPGWDNIHITEMIENRYGKKARLQNDANACALAEWRYGAGKGYDNVVFLTFGTGMGAGLILGGALYTGTNDMAGEVGHIRLSGHGPIGYGKEGSFEGFCSGGGIAQLAQSELLRLSQIGEKAGFAQGLTPGDIDAKIICEAALRGDKAALRIIDTVSEYLGRGLSIIIDILNPEIIIIALYFVQEG